MKYQKWTLRLAAVGIVSLGSVATAEEKMNVVQTALAPTSISGYVDTSAQWNFGTGNQRLPAYRFNSPSKADGFNLDVVQLRLERPLEQDEADWAAGYRVDLWAGPDANSLATQSLTSTAAGDFAVRQAFVALRVPIKNGLEIKMGVFDSIIGYESVESPNDPNYTRSYGHTLEPQTHTGILASYRVSDLVRFTAGVANTLGPTINGRASAPFGTMAESYKTFMGSMEITAPESMGVLANSTFYSGIVNGFSARNIVIDPAGNLTDPANFKQEAQTTYYVGSTIATPVTGLRAGVAFDYIDVHNTSGETWTIAGYTSLQASEKLSLHARAEYLRDRGAQKFFVGTEADPTDPTTVVGIKTNPDKVLALTATAQYDLWKNVISRIELRWDHSLSGEETWGATNPTTGEGSLKNEWLLAANLIYKF
jgi:hypothetical protein